MPPVHHDQYSPFPPPAGSNNQGLQPHLISFFPTCEAPSSTCSISYHPSQALAYDHDRHLSQLQVISCDHHYPSDGSCDGPPCIMPEESGVKNSSSNNKSNQFTCDLGRSTGSVKWMPSKMRFMKKMTSSAGSQQQLATEGGNSSSGNLSNGSARVCSDCNTTKTPLWRSGPQGPKSLCNACGIRQRKARKAMAAAVANGESAASAPSLQKKVKKEKGSDMSARYATIPFKKRCKLSSTKAQENINCLENFSISLDQISSTALHPQDEKEAAILLMALSCGLIHG